MKDSILNLCLFVITTENGVAFYLIRASQRDKTKDSSALLNLCGELVFNESQSYDRLPHIY